MINILINQMMEIDPNELPSSELNKFNLCLSILRLHHELQEKAEECGIQFTNLNSIYNSLHEDLRDLRREVSKGEEENVKDLLLQLAATALKAREDLS